MNKTQNVMQENVLMYIEVRFTINNISIETLIIMSHHTSHPHIEEWFRLL